jgi:hypothetical protein
MSLWDVLIVIISLRIKIVFVVFFALTPIIPVENAHAEDKIEVYFFNDSVNGFQLSDAYETHNMGLRYQTDDYYVQLDLGIVSPDMWVYKNKFRVANRSFGEVVTLELGQPVIDNSSIAYYLSVKSVGEFGIDEMQDFAHRILSLQPVNEINDIVRMPDATWFGFGAQYNTQINAPVLGHTILGAGAYLGSDRGSVQVSISDTMSRRDVTYGYSIGLKAVTHDEIVTATPIEAELRHVIPYASVGVEFDLLGYDVFVREILSFPTIASDNNIFAVLNAGVAYKF